MENKKSMSGKWTKKVTKRFTLKAREKSYSIVKPGLGNNQGPGKSEGVMVLGDQPAHLQTNKGRSRRAKFRV